MADWGSIFSRPEMRELQPNLEFLDLVPKFKAAGCQRVLDAGCGAGRHLLPLLKEGFQVWGVDREFSVLSGLAGRLAASGRDGGRAYLIQADLRRLPFLRGAFDLCLSINVINHGDAAIFQAYCQELGWMLRPGGQLFVYLSPREVADLVRLPHTREPEPGTLIDIATPDGEIMHHFPTPQELRAQFPGYLCHRLEVVQAAIPFMNNATFPQMIFWASKPG